MSDHHASPASQLTPDQQDKLRELTTQSWNLELAISGVAMFAILQLPDLLESAFSYLRYNFMEVLIFFKSSNPADIELSDFI